MDINDLKNAAENIRMPEQLKDHILSKCRDMEHMPDIQEISQTFKVEPAVRRPFLRIAAGIAACGLLVGGAVYTRGLIDRSMTDPDSGTEDTSIFKHEETPWFNFDDQEYLFSESFSNMQAPIMLSQEKRKQLGEFVRSQQLEFVGCANDEGNADVDFNRVGKNCSGYDDYYFVFNSYGDNQSRTIEIEPYGYLIYTYHYPEMVDPEMITAYYAIDSAAFGNAIRNIVYGGRDEAVTPFGDLSDYNYTADFMGEPLELNSQQRDSMNELLNSLEYEPETRSSDNVMNTILNEDGITNSFTWSMENGNYQFQLDFFTGGYARYIVSFPENDSNAVTYSENYYKVDYTAFRDGFSQIMGESSEPTTTPVSDDVLNTLLMNKFGDELTELYTDEQCNEVRDFISSIIDEKEPFTDPDPSQPSYWMNVPESNGIYGRIELRDYSLTCSLSKAVTTVDEAGNKNISIESSNALYTCKMTLSEMLENIDRITGNGCSEIDFVRLNNSPLMNMSSGEAYFDGYKFQQPISLDNDKKSSLSTYFSNMTWETLNVSDIIEIDFEDKSLSPDKHLGFGWYDVSYNENGTVYALRFYDTGYAEFYVTVGDEAQSLGYFRADPVTADTMLRRLIEVSVSYPPFHTLYKSGASCNGEQLSGDKLRAVSNVFFGLDFSAYNLAAYTRQYADEYGDITYWLDNGTWLIYVYADNTVEWTENGTEYYRLSLNPGGDKLDINKELDAILGDH